jgi:dienelactone hydrolase
MTFRFQRPLFAWLAATCLVAGALLSTVASAGTEQRGNGLLQPFRDALSPPAFPAVRVFSVPLPESGPLGASPTEDVVDIYAPLIAPGQRARYPDAFPVVIGLQGANVDNEHYERLGRTLARLGFVFAVPNSYRLFPPAPFGEEVLFSDVTVITRTLAVLEAEANDPDSVLYQIADTGRLGLVGHSLGGAVALYAAADLCVPGICEGDYERPDALEVVAVYGVNALFPPGLDPAFDDIPVALLAGSEDGIAPRDEVIAAFDALPATSKLLFDVLGPNHYGICDVNDPDGAQPDPNEPLLAQPQAIRLVSLSVGVMLRAHLADDPRALDWLEYERQLLDCSVQVQYQDDFLDCP